MQSLYCGKLSLLLFGYELIRRIITINDQLSIHFRINAMNNSNEPLTAFQVLLHLCIKETENILFVASEWISRIIHHWSDIILWSIIQLVDAKQVATVIHRIIPFWSNSKPSYIWTIEGCCLRNGICVFATNYFKQDIRILFKESL